MKPHHKSHAIRFWNQWNATFFSRIKLYFQKLCKSWCLTDEKTAQSLWPWGDKKQWKRGRYIQYGHLDLFNVVWWCPMLLQILLNMGWGNGLLPDGTKSLPQLMLNHHQNIRPLPTLFTEILTEIQTFLSKKHHLQNFVQTLMCYFLSCFHVFFSLVVQLNTILPFF